jgi:hypothetical protein
MKLGKLPVASMAEPAAQLEQGVDKIAVETAGRKRVSGEGTRWRPHGDIIFAG